jgi:uncharacterized Tic20 family protein
MQSDQLSYIPILYSFISCGFVVGTIIVWQIRTEKKIRNQNKKTLNVELKV